MVLNDKLYVWLQSHRTVRVIYEGPCQQGCVRVSVNLNRRIHDVDFDRFVSTQKSTPWDSWRCIPAGRRSKEVNKIVIVDEDSSRCVKLETGKLMILWHVSVNEQNCILNCIIRDCQSV